MIEIKSIYIITNYVLIKILQSTDETQRTIKEKRKRHNNKSKNKRTDKRGNKKKKRNKDFKKKIKR